MRNWKPCKQVRTNRWILVLPLLILSGCGPARDSEPAVVPTGVTFHEDTLLRIGGTGDNWCMTWAADDSQVVSMSDGDWLNQWDTMRHTHLYRIIGGPGSFEREDLPNYPDFAGETGSWFGYGIVSAEGVLYATISKTPGTSWSGPFRGIKLLKSNDNGRSWLRVGRNGGERPIGTMDEARNEVNEAEMFFLEESGRRREEIEAFPFSYVAFVQNGKDGSAAKDDFVYIYSPEGAATNQLLLARAPRQSLGVRNTWEYFANYGRDGKPEWTADLDLRGIAHTFPEKSSRGHHFGWYSWLPSVVWNEGLGLYIMVNGGTYGGYGMTSSGKDYFDRWMHTESGSLGFWWSRKPYGPWTEFFYSEYWVVDDPGNRTYQPKLSPKWISADGREMVLNWSDAMKDAEGRSHQVNYKWNQMKVTIETGG